MRQMCGACMSGGCGICSMCSRRSARSVRTRSPIVRLPVGELLSLRGVSKSFVRGGRSLPVLEDVSLEVAAGEIVGVEGARYSGTTTLLRVAAGIVSPDRGEVWFGGDELT